MSRPQGHSAIGRILCQYPLTPAEIETATYRFVIQHLNHCATAVPETRRVLYQNQFEKLCISLAFIIRIYFVVGEEEEVPYDVQNSMMKFHSTHDICQLQAIYKALPEYSYRFLETLPKPLQTLQARVKL